MISPSFEAEKGSVISSEVNYLTQDMDRIFQIYMDMILLQAKNKKRNMLVIKASSFCEYDTMTKMNIDQQRIEDFLTDDMPLKKVIKYYLQQK